MKGGKYLNSEPDEGGSGLASEESELVVVMSLKWNTINQVTYEYE
jgi:hypothetical protein